MLIPLVPKTHLDNLLMTFEDTCKKVIEVIQAKKPAVFCGAGISFSSGLPIVSSLLDYIFSKLELTSNQTELILNSTLPFESIMEMILRESGLDEIQEIFSGGVPNCNHILIAKLAKKRHILLIYTTNFDTLIEKALEAEGLLSERDFKVYSSEFEFNSIAWEDNCIKVVKIHGCVSKREEMAITMSLIASDRYSAVRRELLHKIFCADQCDNVIVLGYSCSDLDLTPLIESFKSKKSEIIFVDHRNSLDDFKSQDIAVKKEKNPFQNYKGIRLFVNTDQFVEKIWCGILNDEYPRFEAFKTNWTDKIDRWYFNAVEGSGTGLKHHIAARILYAIGEFREAIDHNRKAISIAFADNNMVAYSSEVGNMGMALNACQEFEEAISCFMESIPLCKRIGNLQNLAAQLQAYGNVLHHIHDDETALEIHDEALKYARLENDEYLISNVLGNMSNSYNRLGRYSEAKSSVNQALTISRKLGNKQSESSQLGILSITYSLLGDEVQALKYCIDGLAIKKTIADRHGECMMMVNLIGIYRNLEMPGKAREVAVDCINLAKSIGNKQAEQMALINIALLE